MLRPEEATVRVQPCDFTRGLTPGLRVSGRPKLDIKPKTLKPKPLSPEHPETPKPRNRETLTVPL